jgi:hypothetical protein
MNHVDDERMIKDFIADIGIGTMPIDSTHIYSTDMTIEIRAVSCDKIDFISAFNSSCPIDAGVSFKDNQIENAFAVQKNDSNEGTNEKEIEHLSKEMESLREQNAQLLSFLPKS